MKNQCWNCGKSLEGLPKGRLAFRAQCDHCHSWLHVCKNCTHYHPGMPYDCEMPNIEPIADKEGCNFCDEFSPSGKGIQRGSTSDVSKLLFGDGDDEDEPKDPKQAFNDLFKD